MNFKMAVFLLLISLSDLSHALYGGKSLAAGSQNSAIVTLHLADTSYPEYDEFCTGVLISATKVLTTGHCIAVMGTEVYEKWSIFSYEPNLIKIKIAGVKYQVADVNIAPTYAEAVGYAGEDLAVITLKKAVKGVTPIKIASRGSLKVGLPVTMIARGQVASTKILAVKNYSGNTVIFTDGSKAGICEGDSGGALVVKIGSEQMLAGILSAQGEGCERRTGVSIFPRLF